MALGDLVIKVGGNIDGFRAAMTEASAAADQFTGRIVGTVSEGVGLFDAYGRAVQQAVAPTENLARANIDLAAAGDRVVATLGGVSAVQERVASSSAHAVTEIQATSGAIRTLDGNGGIRAAERFIATTLGIGPAMQAIFPIIGAIALTDLLVKMAEKVIEVTRNFFLLKDAEEAVGKAAKQMAQESEAGLERIAQMQVEALRNQGRLADAARLAQQQLLSKPIKVGSLDDDMLDKLGPYAESLKTVYGEVIPADIPKRIQEINTGLAKAKEELATIKSNGIHIGDTDYVDPISLRFGRQAEVAVQAYENALDRLKIAQRESAQSIGVAGQAIPKAKDEEAQKIEEASRKVIAAEKRKAELIKQGDEDQLAELKSNHELSIGEITKFWQARLSAESGNAQRVHEINIQLGNLYQEQDKIIARVAERGRKVMEEQQKKADEWKSKLEALVVDAEQLNEKIGFGGVDERERAKKATDVDAKSTAQGQEAAATFEKLSAERQFGALLFQTNAARLTMLKQIEAAEEAIAQAKIDALEKEQFAETDIEKKAELGLRLQEAKIQQAERQFQFETRISEEKRKQSLVDQLARQSERIPGAIGNSLAAGIFNGKGIGQDIANALKGIGQQMLGNVFTRLISTTLAHIAATIGLTTATSANAATTTAHSGIMLTHAGVMLTHMGVVVLNTIATIANTLWTAILTAVEAVKSFFGFADGGSPPVGVPSIVGERGPELFIPKEAGLVVPNHALNFKGGASSAMSTSNQSMNFHGDMHFHGVQNVRSLMRGIASVAKTASPGFSPLAR